MEIKYRTLLTTYAIVQDQSNPHEYKCTPRQIILRQQLEWDIIIEHLKELSAEGLVVIHKIENSVGISITEKGFEKAKSLTSSSEILKSKKNSHN